MTRNLRDVVFKFVKKENSYKIFVGKSKSLGLPMNFPIYVANWLYLLIEFLRKVGKLLLR